MKILCFGDIHGRRFWKTPSLKYVDEVDKIVFLGDYMDAYEDEKISYADAIENFKEIIKFKKEHNDKVVLLLGNHDYHYRSFQFEENAKSTRYDSWHAKEIIELFTGENKDLFQICYLAKMKDRNILFSHAGVTKFWLNYCDITIDENIEENINNLDTNKKGISCLTCIGKRRTWFGGTETGSIVWCDLGEFLNKEHGGEDITDFFQVFGHTRLMKGKYIVDENYAEIDCQTPFFINDDLQVEPIAE